MPEEVESHPVSAGDRLLGRGAGGGCGVRVLAARRWGWGGKERIGGPTWCVVHHVVSSCPLLCPSFRARMNGCKHIYVGLVGR